MRSRALPFWSAFQLSIAWQSNSSILTKSACQRNIHRQRLNQGASEGGTYSMEAIKRVVRPPRYLQLIQAKKTIILASWGYSRLKWFKRSKSRDRAGAYCISTRRISKKLLTRRARLDSYNLKGLELRNFPEWARTLTSNRFLRSKIRWKTSCKASQVKAYQHKRRLIEVVSWQV